MSLVAAGRLIGQQGHHVISESMFSFLLFHLLTSLYKSSWFWFVSRIKISTFQFACLQDLAKKKYIRSVILEKIFCGFVCKGQNNEIPPDFHPKTVEKAGKEL